MNSNLRDQLELSNGTIKLDIYQHLKLGAQNTDKNCKCDIPLDNKFYCIPCKISCCPNCSLLDHKMHLLIAKADFEIEANKIEKSFKEFDDVVEKDELFKHLENKKQEIINEVNNTYNELLKMINDWKNKKMEEIVDLFDELTSNFKNINDKEKDCKNALYNFANKNKNFLSLNNSENNKNKDANNTIFFSL